MKLNITVLGLTLACFPFCCANAFFDVQDKEVERKTASAKPGVAGYSAGKHAGGAANPYADASTRKSGATAVPAKAAEVPADKRIRAWVLKPGVTLKDNLAEWSKDAGWELAWNAVGADYMITHRQPINGNYLNAIRQVLNSYRHAEKPLAAKAHQSGGAKILVITPYIKYTNIEH